MSESYNRFNHYLGIEVEKESEDGCIVSLEVKPELYNSLEGIVHGGVTFTLADVAMGHAADPPQSGVQQCVTSEIKINYVAPATGKKLIAESKVVKRGKKLVIMQADIKKEDGELVAVALGTYARISRKTK